jgi:hypothetical protein
MSESGTILPPSCTLVQPVLRVRRAPVRADGWSHLFTPRRAIQEPRIGLIPEAPHDLRTDSCFLFVRMLYVTARWLHKSTSMLRITDMMPSENRFRQYWRKTAAFWEGFWRFGVGPAVVAVPWLAPILVAGPMVLWATLLRVYMFRDLLLASEHLVFNVTV